MDSTVVFVSEQKRFLSQRRYRNEVTDRDPWGSNGAAARIIAGAARISGDALDAGGLLIIDTIVSPPFLPSFRLLVYFAPDELLPGPAYVA